MVDGRARSARTPRRGGPTPPLPSRLLTGTLSRLILVPPAISVRCGTTVHGHPRRRVGSGRRRRTVPDGLRVGADRDAPARRRRAGDRREPGGAGPAPRSARRAGAVRAGRGGAVGGRPGADRRIGTCGRRARGRDRRRVDGPAGRVRTAARVPGGRREQHPGRAGGPPGGGGPEHAGRAVRAGRDGTVHPLAGARAGATRSRTGRTRRHLGVRCLRRRTLYSGPASGRSTARRSGRPRNSARRSSRPTTGRRSTRAAR